MSVGKNELGLIAKGPWEMTKMHQIFLLLFFFFKSIKSLLYFIIYLILCLYF